MLKPTKAKTVGGRIAAGVVHKIPTDLRKALTFDPAARAVWNDLTPLARNEWICWVTYVKKPETRQQHIERVCTELIEGMRRPCCWIGCIHRTDKKVMVKLFGAVGA